MDFCDKVEKLEARLRERIEARVWCGWDDERTFATVGEEFNCLTMSTTDRTAEGFAAFERGVAQAARALGWTK